MDPSQAALQALIVETEALGWDFPKLDVIEEAPPNQEAFALICKLLALKPINSQLVRATLVATWNFAAPLAIEVLAPNKFLIRVPLQDHLDRILHQGPWNIRGSLLLLHPWSPDFAIDEIVLHLCPFWIQVHGLPRQNVTTRNTIIIGKALGSLLEADDLDNSGLICRQHLRFSVELNTSLPLVPGFNLPRPNKEPFWISFRHERLGDYCTLCGLIGHKKPSCPNPPQPYPLAKYNIPLQAFSFSSLRNVSFSLREDSDSGISLDGTTHSRSEAHSSSSHGIESTHL
ncbi:uncharacterized protein LOC133872627 [Alnus glutinosa]|uniref:uncharacterized protein LOC133872627 n=1 Tax=Alnus glutinosa TaxID=3517 RepID=UPI002D792337|nr:uncharacterized protein LOC133872627 [Alnus glutinosa]